MITVKAVTIELEQTLPSGEIQRLIVEANETDEILTSEAWTNGIVGFSDIISAATSCHAHANLRLRAIEGAL